MPLLPRVIDYIDTTKQSAIAMYWRGNCCKTHSTSFDFLQSLFFPAIMPVIRLRSLVEKQKELIVTAVDNIWL